MFNHTLGINFDTSSVPLAIPLARNGYLLPHRLPMPLFAEADAGAECSDGDGAKDAE